MLMESYALISSQAVDIARSRRVCCRPPFWFVDRIPKRLVPSEALLEHSRQHRDRRVDIIVHFDDVLAVVKTMQPPDVLLQRNMPRNRHRQKQGVEARIVESLANVAPGSDDNPRLLFKDEFLHEAGAFFSGNATLEEINAVTVLAKPEAEQINVFGPA